MQVKREIEREARHKLPQSKQAKMAKSVNAALIEALPAWKNVLDALDEERSVIVAIPRHYGGRDILRHFHDHFKKEADCLTFFLQPHVLATSGSIDYAEAWKALQSTLGRRSAVAQQDKLDFGRRLKAALSATKKRCIFLIAAPAGAFAKQYFEFLSLLNNIAAGPVPSTNGPPVRFVAVDDWSLLAYVKALIPPDSSLSDVKRELIHPFSHDQLLEYLRSVFTDCGAAIDIEKVTNDIFNISGGHVGLVNEICREIAARGWKGPTDYSAIKSKLMGSETLEGIRKDIQEDPIGIAITATEFRSPQPVLEGVSPRYQFLQQIGVLKWVAASQSVLCPGLITELFDELSRADRTPRIGTMVAPSGEKFFEASETKLSDDDIVCLHISDIHVGEFFDYKLEYAGNVYNRGKASLGKLIADDLRSLNLLDRVDLIVISGDVVWTASQDEFNRARDVINEILALCKIKKEKMVLVPGNHDLMWNPSVFAGKSAPGARVSRESYDTFAQLLGLEKLDTFSFHEILSRSERLRLRVIGIDSNYVEGPENAGIGFVDSQALDKIDQEIDRAEKKAQLTWIVTHHHVLPITSTPESDARLGKISVMGNAAELLSRAAKWKAELVLHGHEHQPGITVAMRWTSDFPTADFHPLVVLCAGSCGAKREKLGPISRNHYHVVIRRAESMTIRSRVMGEEGLCFLTHRDFQIPMRRPVITEK
jgi:3',5'-cyclic AMP phosphodiesterase CpdA